MRSSKYNAPLLAPIVASSRSLSEVLRRLGLSVTGGNHRMITTRIRQAGLDTSHFTYGTGRHRMEELSREMLQPLVSQCTSFAQILVKLEMPTEGRPHRELTDRISQLELDTSHFTGSAWSRGETRESHPALDRIGARRMLPNADVFVENGPMLTGPKLVRRLRALGWPYRCAWCSIEDWRGKPLVLHLDHINGLHTDNRFENLRLLCPNCHSQTDTYCNRRRPDATL